MTGTVGASAGLGADVSVGASFQISNANDIAALGDKFYYASLGGQYNIAGASATVFWSPDFSTYGIEFGPAFGGGVVAGIGESYTGAFELDGLAATLARAAWDINNPALAGEDLLDLARAYICQQVVGTL